jgi:hypothetical protein
MYTLAFINPVKNSRSNAHLIGIIKPASSIEFSRGSASRVRRTSNITGSDGDTMDRDVFWANDNESDDETTIGEVCIDGYNEPANQRYAEITDKESERTSGKSDVESMTDEKGSM